MTSTAPIPPEDASLTSEQTTSTVTKIKILQKPPPTSHLKAWQRSLPSPSLPRRLASLQETPLDLSSPDLELQCTSKANSTPDTILYLAYGSNLSAETFLGKRGVRPISQVNVAVPELVMTFDLPGLPYTEPCFANTAYRHSKTSSPPSSTSSEKAPLLPSSKNPKYHNPSWPKPLVGVVYEVTPSDFAHIIATEGGGSSYKDVLVDCHPLPAGTSTVPPEPTTPAFRAHTLFSPLGAPDEPPPKDGGRFSRPDPDYAQPSARYLKLLRDGGEEHGLPSEYMGYLEELQPYMITMQKQRLGMFVFKLLWFPIVMAVFQLGKIFHDKRGRNPPWLARLLRAVFSGVWMSYDGFFKGLFGDGERTQEKDRGEGEERRTEGDWEGPGEKIDAPGVDRRAV